ncbi:hypothetical protein [Tsukamurella tyrosinosolvens]|uniref:hypothetical protein n=1 Tax=Tsukamurella tyrosinosolvens TaxID=57704 RepID=UPI002DD42A16|nr:hypothetical protein [Tsukamurella tyrosinosolvens]MEC4616315.1 hypothetical protein [Tsukamurella tyrosinosolvens]
MNGPEHYAEAEQLLAIVDVNGTDPRDAAVLAAAQVHATLALAAATALGSCFAATGPMESDVQQAAAWDDVIRTAS